MRKEGDRLPSSVLIAVLLLCLGFIVPLVMVEGGMRLYAWMTSGEDLSSYFMTRPESYTTLQKSFLVTWIREQLYTSKKVVNPNLSTGFGSLPAETKKAVMQEYAYMVGPKAVSTALTRIGSWAQSKQVPVYIVFGSLKDGQYSLLRQVAKRTGAKLVGVKEAVERYFTERGIVTP